jgi:hypothetical protein
LLRALKSIGKDENERSLLQSAMVKTYVNDAFRCVEWFAAQALAAIADEKTLEVQLSAVEKVGRVLPLNTVALRREVANAVIKIGRYPF